MSEKTGPRPRAVSAPEFQRGPFVLYNPDGTPMHWSEAAKRRYGLHPGSTSGVVSAPPVEPTAAPMPAGWGPMVERAAEIRTLPKSRRQGDRVPWSASVGIMVMITVLALGGAVIPFCVMNWESLEWSSWFGGSATEGSVAAEVVATETQDREASVSYLNAGSSLTFVAPTGWDSVSPELLADYEAGSTYLAAVAESAGPTLAGVFLNGMVVKALDVPQGEDLAPGLAQKAAESFVDGGLDSYDYFEVLTPTRESTVGTFYAQTATARITWNERVLVKSVYAFVAGDGLYQVELCVDDVDWGDYQDVFESILDSFALAEGAITPQ